MENTQPAPKSNPNPTTPDLPNLPAGTYEYVDTNKKRNWKKIIEITLVVVIVSVPLVLSLFRVEYSLKRSYAVLDPAAFITKPSYETWGNIITAAKNIILQQTPTPTPVLTPTPTVSTESTPVEPTQAAGDVTNPTQSQEQSQYSPDSQEQTSSQTQTEEQESTATQNEEQAANATQEYSYPSPSTSEEQEDDETSEQTTATSATLACTGKKKNAACSYKSSYGYTIKGQCKTFYGGTLTCSSSSHR